ncbi:hypothetical protein ACJX0J_032864, partial [Zea mays]
MDVIGHGVDRALKGLERVIRKKDSIIHSLNYVEVNQYDNVITTYHFYCAIFIHNEQMLPAYIAFLSVFSKE